MSAMRLTVAVSERRLKQRVGREPRGTVPPRSNKAAVIIAGEEREL